MRVDSHYNLHKGSASVDKSQASAKLDFRELTAGIPTLDPEDGKDTLQLSDGAKAHIAESLTGPDGAGDGKQYARIISFLKKAVEDSLGTSVGSLNIDGLEVDSHTKTLKTKSCTPNEVGADPSLVYRVNKSDINLKENHIAVQGTVKTSDGKSLAYTLDLDFVSAVGSQTNSTYRASGDAAKNPPMTMFDGVARELSDVSFQFDSDPSEGLLKGKGTNVVQGEKHQSYSKFRRCDWQA